MDSASWRNKWFLTSSVNVRCASDYLTNAPFKTAGKYCAIKFRPDFCTDGCKYICSLNNMGAWREYDNCVGRKLAMTLRAFPRSAPGVRWGPKCLILHIHFQKRAGKIMVLLFYFFKAFFSVCCHWDQLILLKVMCEFVSWGLISAKHCFNSFILN